MSIRVVQISDLKDIVRSNVGLVFGPGAAAYPTFESDLYEFLAKVLGKRVASNNWLDLADEAIAASPSAITTIRAEVSNFLRHERPESLNIASITKNDWSCVVSLSVELALHAKLKERLDSEPSGWQLTTIADARASIPINTLPYFAMLGDSREAMGTKRLCITGAEYLERKRTWPKMLQPLTDIVKANPIVFLGTSTVAPRVVDFIDQLYSLYPRCPTRFIFLESDECVRSARLQNIVGDKGDIIVVAGQQHELLTAISKEQRDIHALPIFAYRETDKISFEELRPVSDFIVPVPPKAAVPANPAERKRNLDALFRSASLDWAPFALDLNFVRDFEEEIYGYISKEWATVPKHLKLVGEAGCGKSVSLKSIAFRLASDGNLVVWLRRSYGDISGNNLSLLTPALSKAVGRSGARVVIFVDDPISCGFDPDDVASALKPLSAEWRIISCSRKTDLIGRTDTASKKAFGREFPNNFNEAEWKRLPQYLVTIGICQSIVLAQRELSRVPAADGRDVLCALWYLLPQTKETLFHSLSNEYFRLGGLETTIKRIAQAVSGDAAKVVKTAYECVTVCAGLDRTPLPLEVLVGALGVTYQQWNEHCEHNAPVWGLLVTEYVESADTYVYRNRNDVVTNVLLGLINGPDGYHAGEYRMLKLLLSACVSGQPQYVEFIKWVLVERREKLEERLSLEQLTELYDIALKACPIRLGIVEHHRAVARSHKNANPLDVHAELISILKASNGSREEHGDSLENIHTSAAAALARAIRANLVEPIAITKEIFGHVERALGTNRINWHAYHTQAKTLVELAAQTKSSSPKFAIKCFTEANQITERALLLLDPVGGGQNRFSEDILFFRGIRNNLILNIGDIEKAKAAAERLFNESSDQSAYVMVLRAMASSAAESDRNSDYKYFDDFARLIGSRIVNAQKEISPEIIATRVENEFRWKVIKGSGSTYDVLAALRDTQLVMEVEPFKSDMTWSFRAAVLAFLARDYTRSEAYFTGLRRLYIDHDLKTSVRCYYLNTQGKKHILEGRISNVSHPRIFIYSAELENDILGYVGEFGNTVERTIHFYLGFTMNGPIACPITDIAAKVRIP